MTKLECLVALCRALLHPQLIRKFLAEEKFGVKKILSTQDGAKYPEMYKKSESGKKFLQVK